MPAITVPPSTAVTDTATLTGTNAGRSTDRRLRRVLDSDHHGRGRWRAKTITTPGTLTSSSRSRSRRDLLLAGVVLRGRTDAASKS